MHNIHNDLLFLPERIKIEKVEKLVANLHGKEEYVIQIRKLKEALKHELASKKVQILIKFKEKVCLKPYIDMNTELRKKSKNDFENFFSSL